MAARWTGLRMTGIALAGLCFTSVAHAQVGYTGPTVGCFGVTCVPLVSVGAYTATGFAVPWVFDASKFPSQTVGGTIVPTAFAMGFPSRGNSSSALASNRVGRDDDGKADEGYRGNRHAQGDRDDRGNGGGRSHLSHFNPATVIYTGLAAAAFVSFLNSSSSVSETPVVASSLQTQAATAPMTTPVTAHVEFAPTATLVATTDLVTTPEPTTETLMASGLVALGMLVVIRRRRRANC
jgi:MYXO-CTERM domain-containing protein